MNLENKSTLYFGIGLLIIFTSIFTGLITSKNWLFIFTIIGLFLCGIGTDYAHEYIKSEKGEQKVMIIDKNSTLGKMWNNKGDEVWDKL